MKFVLALSCILVGVLASPARNRLSWRIVGGEDAAAGQFPYQVSLRFYGSHSCGGSILDETTILCAAHCVAGGSPSSMTVVTGSTKLNSGGKSYKVADLRAHPDYDSWDITNDISIVKLAEPIEFNDAVQPVKIRQSIIGGEEVAILSGWGTKVVGGNTPNDLQWIKLQTLSYEECKAIHTGYVILESEVCTFTQRGEGACHGDSGGPLVDENGEQIGIVSWGIPCAQGRPDVFTRTSSFLDWIEENRK